MWHKRRPLQMSRPLWCHRSQWVWYLKTQSPTSVWSRRTVGSQLVSKPLKMMMTTTNKSNCWCSRQNSAANNWCRMWIRCRWQNRRPRNKDGSQAPKHWRSGRRPVSSRPRIDTITTRSSCRTRRKRRPTIRSQWTLGSASVLTWNSQLRLPQPVARTCRGWRRRCWRGSKTWQASKHNSRCFEL